MFSKVLSKELSGKVFVKMFIIISALICSLMILFMYIIDPWLYYRINKNNYYWLDSAYVSAGLIKNRQYDTAVIGSSYFQNFKMNWFRQKLGYEPINLTVPALDAKETPLMVDKVLSEGKAKNLVICLTYYTFASTVTKSRLPDYLLDNKDYNDVQYLLSYEAWVKFLPLDILTPIINKINPKLLDRYKSMMDIDSLGNGVNRFTYGKNQVIKGYSPVSAADSNPQQTLARMKENFNNYFEKMEFDTHHDINYIFILPPHSALYWYSVQKSGLYDTYQQFEIYALEKFAPYKNVRIINAQSIPEITDLNHYLDTTHFDIGIQESLIDMIISGKNDLNLNNVAQKQYTLSNLVKEFASQNKDWLEKPKH